MLNFLLKTVDLLSFELHFLHTSNPPVLKTGQVAAADFFGFASPSRQLALSLKMFTEHFLYALSLEMTLVLSDVSLVRGRVPQSKRLFYPFLHRNDGGFKMYCVMMNYVK